MAGKASPVRTPIPTTRARSEPLGPGGEAKQCPQRSSSGAVLLPICGPADPFHTCALGPWRLCPPHWTGHPEAMCPWPRRSPTCRWRKMGRMCRWVFSIKASACRRTDSTTEEVARGKRIAQPYRRQAHTPADPQSPTYKTGVSLDSRTSSLWDRACECSHYCPIHSVTWVFTASHHGDRIQLWPLVCHWPCLFLAHLSDANNSTDLREAL